jgi:hypothetical protein
MEIFFGVLLILMAHYVGDFVFQSRDIATKKSESIGALSIHILIYSMTVFIILFIGLYFMEIVASLHVIQMAVGITIVNGLFHYIIDFFTSKINAYFWKAKKIRNFWLTIGFDQLLHTSLLVYCYAEMLGNFGYI